MENDYFMNACWQAMGMNPSTNQSQSQSQSQSPDCFYNNSNWDNSPLDQGAQHFESALSSMVSSPAASNSNVSGDVHMIRELVGKLGKIGHSSAATSCYSTPLNSPPKTNLPGRDHLVNETFPKLMALNSTVAELSADPGFAERAARFSCFGSRSFNGRTAPYALNSNSTNFNNNNSNNLELPYGSSPSMRLPRVSSSPSLKALAPQIRKNSEINNSQEVSSISQQNHGGEIAANGFNSRKRKAVSKGKAKDSATIKGSSDISDDPNAKRIKNGGDVTEKDTVKAEDDDEKKNKDGLKKAEEPFKDYIHVRARRGQATDSHSLAERVRREKISERMKLLQDLVPGCNKVIGKALMLDEIINYVQSLQRQVEFLSMKLATVNNTTTMDFNMEALMSSKDMLQPNNNPMFESSSAPVFHGQGAAVDTHLPPPLNDLQYQDFHGGDLQTIVDMGFAQQDSCFGIPSFHGSSSAASQMKTEL